MAVSPTHCRPGLAMTFNELSEAKALILDLLGWGMSPENLVEAGISKQCLVPCLRELKLRLPTNIDLSDVVLYDPPKDITPTLTSNIPTPSPNDGGDRLVDTGEQEGSSDALPASSPYKRKRKNMAHHQARASLPNSFTATPSAPGEQATSLLQRLQTTGQPGNEPNSSGGIANVSSARHRSLPPPPIDDKQQQDTPSGPALRGQKKPGRGNGGRGRWAGRGRGFHAASKQATNTITHKSGPNGGPS